MGLGSEKFWNRSECVGVETWTLLRAKFWNVMSGTFLEFDGCDNPGKLMRGSIWNPMYMRQFPVHEGCENQGKKLVGCKNPEKR